MLALQVFLLRSNIMTGDVFLHRGVGRAAGVSAIVLYHFNCIVIHTEERIPTSPGT